MARLSGPWGLAPPGGAGYGTNTALLAAIWNRLAAAGQITGCDCRACLGAPEPPICVAVGWGPGGPGGVQIGMICAVNVADTRSVVCGRGAAGRGLTWAGGGWWAGGCGRGGGVCRPGP